MTLSVQPTESSTRSRLRFNSLVSFQRESIRSAMGMNSVPSGVSSICLNPLLRVMSAKSSSFSSTLSRWLMVGWERNRVSAVLEMLFVLTMVKNISTSVRSIEGYLLKYLFFLYYKR